MIELKTVVALMERCADFKAVVTKELEDITAKLAEVENNLGAIKKQLQAATPAADLDADKQVGCKSDIDPRFVADCMDLTMLESQVAALLAEGRSTGEIAATLRRQERIVRRVLTRINRKLGITTQSQLVRLVLQLPHGGAAATPAAGKERPGGGPGVTKGRSKRGRP